MVAWPRTCCAKLAARASASAQALSAAAASCAEPPFSAASLTISQGADSIKSARSTAEAVNEDFEELQAPGPAAPFAGTPLTSLPSVAPDEDDVRPHPECWLCAPL